MDFITIRNIEELVIARFAEWWAGLITLLPNLIGAVVILIAFYGLSRLVNYLVHRGIRRSSFPTSLKSIIARIASVVVIIIGLIIALNALGLQKTVTTALAGAGVLGLALGFAFQDVAANFIAGIFLVVRRPFSEGDFIAVKDQSGTVIETNLRATKLRTPDGQMVYVPNKDVFKSDVTNYSELGVRRVDVSCGISYDDSIDHARETAQAAVTSLQIVDDSRPVEVYFDGFADSAIEFTLRFWINFSNPADYPKAKNKSIKAIKEAFEREDIDIPFPVRTLNFSDKADNPLHN